jgi:hypothetical protein
MGEVRVKTLAEAIRDYLSGAVDELYMQNMTQLLDELGQVKEYQSIIEMSITDLEEHVGLLPVQRERLKGVLAAVFQAGLRIGMDAEKNELKDL